MDDPKDVDAEQLRAEMRASIEKARRRHEFALEVFNLFLDALSAHTASLKAGENVQEGDVRDAIKNFAQVYVFASKEAEKYERHVLENTGLVADAPLDLDAIRAEIGGRLDRLRATR